MTDTTTTVELAIKSARQTRTPRVQAPPFNVTTDSQGNQVVELMNLKLINDIRNCTSNLENLYDKVPKIEVSSLFDELPSLQSELADLPRNPALTRLVRFLEAEFQMEMDRCKRMVSSGVVSFSALRLLLKPGTEVALQGAHIQGAKIVETEYRSSFFGNYLEITYEYITSNGREFSNAREHVYISGYRGVKDITKLNAMPMTDQIKERLTERGSKYLKLGVGSHYMHFTGHMEVMKWYSYTPMRASGRMMVDLFTHNQFRDGGDRHVRRGDQTSFQRIEPDQLWMTEPYVNGFSFTAKQWGRFPVDNISDIEFRSDAYNQLVMDPERKAMVRALVEDSSSGFSDIIAGKGGGCIFLLHGEPGTGKTLTAEAVSELLHRPLYSVSVGELGTDTTTLEKNLRQILDVAQIWNAVILIDEADIFLEKRTGGDILRNAMVGIFLKLLEYHQGVMFLTTNRVREFDTAFHSRISVAMRYAALNREARESIWRSLLAAAQIDGLDPATLAEHEINGRQIKNTIRLAQSLARQESVQVAAGHITRCLGVSQQFVRDLAE